MKMTKTTALAAALAATEVFRAECRTDIGSQTISCFLQVAMRGEMPMFDLIDLLGLSNAGVSRNISRLGQGAAREVGLGLVMAYEDPEFRRRKLVKLTDAGEKLAEKIVKSMNSVVAVQ